MPNYSLDSRKSHLKNEYHIYQDRPVQTETYRVYGRKMWTTSLQSFQDAARKEFYCLSHNGRCRLKYRVTLNLLRTYLVPDVPKLLAERRKLFAYLGRKKSIVSYAVVEVTRNDFKTVPTDRVHFTFLIDTALTASELKTLFERACKAAGYREGDYRISEVLDLEGMPEEEYEQRVLKYVVKFDCKVPGKIILFKPNLGLRKTYTIGSFWTDGAGNRTTKAAIWEPIRWQTIRKYQGQSAPSCLRSVSDPGVDPRLALDPDVIANARNGQSLRLVPGAVHPIEREDDGTMGFPW